MRIEFGLVEEGAVSVGIAESVGGAVRPASLTDVQAFAAVLQDAGGSSMSSNPLEHYAEAVGSKYAAWRDDWMTFGNKIDITDQRSAVRVLEHQAKVSGQAVEFQFALQSADSVRHAFKTLTQQQA